MEVSPGCGSDRPELDPRAEADLFVAEGSIDVSTSGAAHKLCPGGYAYIPAGTSYTVFNNGSEAARFHWIRKAYVSVDGLEAPGPIFLNEQNIAPTPMPDTDGCPSSQSLRPEALSHVEDLGHLFS